jgi:hypothetical protein
MTAQNHIANPSKMVAPDSINNAPRRHSERVGRALLPSLPSYASRRHSGAQRRQRFLISNGGTRFSSSFPVASSAACGISSTTIRSFRSSSHKALNPGPSGCSRRSSPRTVPALALASLPRVVSLPHSTLSTPSAASLQPLCTPIADPAKACILPSTSMSEERLAALMKVECHRIRMLTILDATIIVRTEGGAECFTFDSPEAAEAAFSAWLDAQHSRSEKGAPE